VLLFPSLPESKPLSPESKPSPPLPEVQLQKEVVKVVVCPSHSTPLECSVSQLP